MATITADIGAAADHVDIAAWEASGYQDGVPNTPGASDDAVANLEPSGEKATAFMP